MRETAGAAAPSPEKFADPEVCADGAPRARVGFEGLRTLWVNTGSLCNITCANCYIESSPSNDRLAYFTPEDLVALLDELDAAQHARLATDAEIGFTGGEPFLNPHIGELLALALGRGRRALVLTNAMRPMRRPAPAAALKALIARHGDRLTLRVSLDHYAPEPHDAERGPGAFAAALDGLCWLAREGAQVAVAGRIAFAADEAEARAGYARLFAEHAIPVDAHDPAALVLFPEMDLAADVPEITEACWGILSKSPSDVMCASSRMALRRKGAAHATIAPCTLLAYDRALETGPRLADALEPVALNHPFCAQFCVLGGASCAT